jgi:hypothetical protein
MKATNVFSFFKWIWAIAVPMSISGCQGNMESPPAPPPTQAQILEGGKWMTTAGTLVSASGASVTLPPGDPFFSSVLLGDVTFYPDGTAMESNDPNGLTKYGLTWHLNGTHLLVNINDNNTDKVNAVITLLSQYKLVLDVSDFYVYKGVTYDELIQTLTH